MMADDHGYTLPLFDTMKAKGSSIYKLFALSQFLGIIFIFVYRATQSSKSWPWIGMFVAELWFGFYWILTQAPRCNRIDRRTFKERLSQRYEDDLPDVDVFVCTADPAIEPPTMVMNTVLSVMAYDYPPEKLSVYLSDDACSEITFYALLETSEFAKHWLPYCKKFKVEPRSPEAHFRSSESGDKMESDQSEHLESVKKIYRDMEERIELVEKLESVSKNALFEHRGFSKWDSYVSARDHDTIVQILINGRDANSKDTEGSRLPTLVYLAREKRPQHFHNFKAGAMNALIRVSSEISNAPIILNVDCDMYSNNSTSIRDALCFLLDEEKGHDIAYVQFPQKFHNVTKNELYGGSLRGISEVEFHGLDGLGGPLYVGTGCFHRRDALSGRKFNKGTKFEWKQASKPNKMESNNELEDRVKALASCNFEKDTKWGTEMGLRYGVPVEDVITGLSIQCNGWKSIYYNPKRPSFLGLAAMTLDQTLVMHKRWSEGDLQILLSTYSPVWYGLNRISIGLIMGYCSYCFWSLNCFATLYYSVIPSLQLLKGTSLFPRASSKWVIPFAYVMVSEMIYSYAEFRWCGGTPLGWWNEQRMWLYKRASSYLFATIDTLLKMMGYSDSGFVVSPKVTEEKVLERYEKELMEFGTESPMFTILCSLAMINLSCAVALIVKAFCAGMNGLDYEAMALQIVLCGVLSLINFPLYSAAFFRKDKGRLLASTTVKSAMVAVSLCSVYAFV